MTAQVLATVTTSDQLSRLEPILRGADNLLTQYTDLQFGKRGRENTVTESKEVREKKALDSLEKISKQGPIRGGFADVLNYVSGLTQGKQ